MNMSNATLDAFDLENQPAMVFFSDREGSQNLVNSLVGVLYRFGFYPRKDLKNYL